MHGKESNHQPYNRFVQQNESRSNSMSSVRSLGSGIVTYRWAREYLDKGNRHSNAHVILGFDLDWETELEYDT